MTLALPWALGLLAPWAALAAWAVLRRRGEVRGVTGVFLWSAARGEPASRPRAVRRVTRREALLLLAALLLIVAAAGPGWKLEPARPRVALDAQRGRALSGVAEGDKTVRAAAVVRSTEALGARGVDVSVRVGDDRPDVRGADRGGVRATDEAVRVELRAPVPTTGVAGELARRSGESGEQARRLHGRTSLPLRAAHNVGFERFAVRYDPARTRALIALAVTGAARRVRVDLADGTRISSATLDVPADGRVERVLDLPAASSTWRATLTPLDDLPPDAMPWDDVAFAARASPPRVVPTVDAPALARFADAFARASPPDAAARAVRLGTDDVLVPTANLAFARGPLRATAHPLVADVDLRRFAALPVAPAPAGFAPVAWVGDVPFLAARADAVWLGVDPAAAANEPAYVALLANAVDLLAPTADATTSVDVDQLSNDAARTDLLRADLPGPAAWWAADRAPGLYAHAGRTLATNVPFVADLAASELADPLPAFTPQPRTLDLRAVPVLLALAALIVALRVDRRGSRRSLSRHA